MKSLGQERAVAAQGPEEASVTGQRGGPAGRIDLGLILCWKCRSVSLCGNRGSSSMMSRFSGARVRGYGWDRDEMPFD